MKGISSMNSALVKFDGDARRGADLTGGVNRVVNERVRRKRDRKSRGKKIRKYSFWTLFYGKDSRGGIKEGKEHRNFLVMTRIGELVP